MREPDTALVRVFNATMERDGWTSKHTIIETANDDMPFLVDSLEVALTRIGHPIYVTIHPQLRVARSRQRRDHRRRDRRRGKIESFIHFEVVRETDAALLAATEAALTATLRDVRAAVEDWPKMLERLRTARQTYAQPRAFPTTSKPNRRVPRVARARSLHAARLPRVRARRRRCVRHAHAAHRAPGLGLLRAEHGDAIVRLTGNARAEARSSHAARDHEVERALDGPPACDARSRRHQGIRRQRQAACRSGASSVCSRRARTTRVRARFRCCE